LAPTEPEDPATPPLRGGLLRVRIKRPPCPRAGSTPPRTRGAPGLCGAAGRSATRGGQRPGPRLFRAKPETPSSRRPQCSCNPFQLPCIPYKPHGQWRRSETSGTPPESRRTRGEASPASGAPFGPAPSRSHRRHPSEPTWPLPCQLRGPSGTRRGSADFSTEDLRGACPPHICFWGPATPGPALVPCFWPPTQLPPSPSLPSPWCFAPSRQPPAPPGAHPLQPCPGRCSRNHLCFAWCPLHATTSAP
jgi:hypothetical protein